MSRSSLTNPIRLSKLLSSVLGLVTRSGVGKWARTNRISLKSGEPLPEGFKSKVNPREVLLNGEPLQYLEPLNVAMYKPRGFECSRARTAETELIYDLLPPPFFFRLPRLVAAGRLDKWASGLLILSQDGQYVHQLCSPKRRQGHPIRVYEIELVKPLSAAAARLLSSGQLRLKSDDTNCLPVGVKVLNSAGNLIELTLHEGRYHQIRRMLAVVDNQALSIHRTQIGQLRLDDLQLKPGKWTVMEPRHLRDSLVGTFIGLPRKERDPEKEREQRVRDYARVIDRFYPSDAFDAMDEEVERLEQEEDEKNPFKPEFDELQLDQMTPLEREIEEKFSHYPVPKDSPFSFI